MLDGRRLFYPTRRELIQLGKRLLIWVPVACVLGELEYLIGQVWLGYAWYWIMPLQFFTGWYLVKFADWLRPRRAAPGAGEQR